MNLEIYRQLKDRILFLEYEPGRILNEQVLAAEFGVSRTPLRAVLNRLEWEHLVRILPRTGTMVTEIELNKILDVFRIRLDLEETVGSLATGRFSPRDLDRFEQLRTRCRALLDDKDRRALAGIDIALKDLFHKAADNSLLTEISERLYALTFRLWYRNMERGDWTDEVQTVLAELDELIPLLKSDLTADLGRIRRNQLMICVERIRNKFLGLAI